MSEETKSSKERLLKVLNSAVPAEEVIEAIDALIDSKIADFAVLLADRSEEVLGARL